MNNHADRWVEIHSGENEAERALARMEADDARGRNTETCGICGKTAYYRPGVGAYQCQCGALLTYNCGWVTT